MFLNLEGRPAPAMVSIAAAGEAFARPTNNLKHAEGASCA